MGTFKLSFEASEIDEKLKSIEEGGVGYTDENGTIHPIDPKFLPGVCLPVVELSTVIPSTSGSTVELTEAESAALDSTLENNAPCIIRFPVSTGHDFVALFNFMTKPVKNYVATYHLTASYIVTVQIQKGANGWTASVN